ncbi:MAG: Spy/CpxP family protein refolding chaperone [Gemmatimonadota bacterium]|nr:MAG: Spy/CpxP family protein refolding chaperone [Gemmatimonadota bacterium]
MKKILGTATFLTLSALLAVSGTALGQEEDTTRTRGMRARRGVHSGMMGQRMGQRGVDRAGWGRAGHVGPHMLLGFKEELELTDQQVEQLEQLGEGHRALMQAQMERLQEHREAVRQARAESDYDALERLIEEGAELQAGVARGLLNVERETLDVLTDGQREKYTAWREGIEIFRRHQRDRWRQDRESGMRGRGMRQRQRVPQPPPPPGS